MGDGLLSCSDITSALQDEGVDTSSSVIDDMGETVDALQLRQHAIKAHACATHTAGDAPEATIDRAGGRS
jgi:hypothetical protein